MSGHCEAHFVCTLSLVRHVRLETTVMRHESTLGGEYSMKLVYYIGLCNKFFKSRRRYPPPSAIVSFTPRGISRMIGRRPTPHQKGAGWLCIHNPDLFVDCTERLLSNTALCHFRLADFRTEYCGWRTTHSNTRIRASRTRKEANTQHEAPCYTGNTTR